LTIFNQLPIIIKEQSKIELLLFNDKLRKLI